MKKIIYSIVITLSLVITSCGKHNSIEVNEQNLNATTEVEKGKTISYVLVSTEPAEKIEAEVF